MAGGDSSRAGNPGQAQGELLSPFDLRTQPSNFTFPWHALLFSSSLTLRQRLPRAFDRFRPAGTDVHLRRMTTGKELLLKAIRITGEVLFLLAHVLMSYLCTDCRESRTSQYEVFGPVNRGKGTNDLA